MKNESNTYNINNPDGSQGKSYDYKKLRFDNDSKDFIKENPIADQGEFFQAAESFDDPKQPSQKKEKRQDEQQSFDESSSSSSTSSSSSSASSSASSASSSASSAASSASSAASSAASSVASSIGSGIGALAGAVATAAVAAAVIVVAVINAFVLNISLLMSTESSFIFQVEMTGSEEDFAEPIYAILSGADGTEQQCELQQGITNITFENLTSGEEYILRIRNSEKILAERSYVTPNEAEEKGFVEMRSDNKYVHVSVGNVNLAEGEFYTLVVKDAKSKVVLSKDGTESSGNYKIAISEETELFATLSIDGKIYAVAQISVRPEKELDPNFDFNNGVWKWSETFDAAQVSFARKDGGEPLVLTAAVKKEVTAPTCEEDGYTTFTATVLYENRTFTDQKVETDEDTALGHAYGEPVFEWVEAGDGYVAKVTVTCANDATHQIVEDAELTFEETPADCENDRCVSYYATFNFNDEEYTDEKVVTFEDSALGHAYGEPVFEWIESEEGFVVTATFTCLNDETHQTVENAVVTFEETPADCENDAYITYTATIELDEATYSDEKVVTIEYSALGHKYADPDFWWSVADDGYTARAIFTCLNDETHQAIKDAEITFEETPAICEEDGYITYIATVVMGEEIYSDENVIVYEYSATGHDYGEPVFDWVETGDGWVVDATFTCRNDEMHQITASAVVTSQETPADCENNGYITYTATVERGLTSYADEKIVTIENIALGHEYGEPVFVWLDLKDGFTVTATFTCVHNANHQIVNDALVDVKETPADCETDAYLTYTATTVLNNVTYSDDKVVTIADTATGHEYGEPVFNWIETNNGYTVTATFTCGNNEEHQLVKEANVDVVETLATCEANSYITYTATVELDVDISYSDDKVVTIENTATGHNYGEPVFDWIETSDGYTVTATFTCVHNANHQIVNDALVDVAETPADCETDEYLTYTATTVLNNVTYSDDKVVTIADTATGHEYGEPFFEWIESANGYTAKAICICANNQEHQLEYEAEVGFEEYPADCEYDRTICYYASAVIGEDEYDDEKVVTYEGTALGHTYSNLIPETIADCENDGVSAHYECSVCGKYFVGTDEVKQEVSWEDIVTPAFASLTQLTSNNLSQDLIGRKVKIMTTSGSGINVLLGADGAVSDEDYTTFYIESVGNGSVVLYELRGTAKYYLSTNTGTITFGSTTPTAINVDDLGVEVSSETVSTYLYILHGTSSIYLTNGKLGGMPDVDVAIYLLPAHTYGEPEFVWAQTTDDDGYGATAIFTCSVCMKSIAVKATVSRDGDFYYAEAEFNGKYYNAELQVGNGNYEIVGGLTVITADMLSGDMIDPSAHPSANLFDGFVEGNFTSVSNMQLDIGDQVYVIFAFDEEGFYICRFENGLCTDAEPYHDVGTTIENLLSMVNAGDTFCYTVGATNDNPSGGPAEIIPIEGLTAITADMLSGDMIDPSARLSANLFEGFVEANWSSLSNMQFEDEGTFYIIYAIDSEGFYIGSFGDGVCINENAEPYHDVETTIANLLQMINEGLRFYYVSDESLSGGDSPSGGTAEIIPIEGLTAITADMLSGSQIDSTAHPSANLFDGFVEANWSSVSNMQFDAEGTFYVIYGFAEGGFYVCAFDNGLIRADFESYLDDSTTIAGLLEMINSGTRFYYTSAALSG